VIVGAVVGEEDGAAVVGAVDMHGSPQCVLHSRWTTGTMQLP
jgi:hypothetical protein